MFLFYLKLKWFNCLGNILIWSSVRFSHQQLVELVLWQAPFYSYTQSTLQSLYLKTLVKVEVLIQSVYTAICTWVINVCTFAISGYNYQLQHWQRWTLLEFSYLVKRVQLNVLWSIDNTQLKYQRMVHRELVTCWFSIGHRLYPSSWHKPTALSRPDSDGWQQLILCFLSKLTRLHHWKCW